MKILVLFVGVVVITGIVYLVMGQQSNAWLLNAVGMKMCYVELNYIGDYGEIEEGRLLVADETCQYDRLAQLEDDGGYSIKKLSDKEQTIYGFEAIRYQVLPQGQANTIEEGSGKICDVSINFEDDKQISRHLFVSTNCPQSDALQTSYDEGFILEKEKGEKTNKYGVESQAYVLSKPPKEL